MNTEIIFGALIKLGIKREMIGDILIDENGADIVCLNDIKEFLLQNLCMLTRFQKSQIEEVKISDIKIVENKIEEFNITVASMRLDNIVAELAKCSRSKALEYLVSEKVLVNYEVITKQTKEIKEKDRIAIRGKGRFFISEIEGNTRKGKIILKVEK